MVRDEEGFLYPHVDEELCVECGLCEKRCPVIHTPEPNSNTEKAKVYAAYTNDENVRLSSSSGGIFTEIAKHVINRGGVVFGAAFDDDWSVKHMWIDSLEDIDKLRRSKYVQSIIGDSYKEAEAFLKQGKLVYFTGTPCQINGLYTYLNRSYENLITQDFICHGAPSPLVWEKYVDEQIQRKGKKPVAVSFRDKTFGWKMFSMRFDFDDHTQYVENLTVDPYMKVFLSDLCLRPSCHSCAFKKEHRPSDITLADFWGIQRCLPEMNDGKGVSAVFINSPKGQEIFDSVKDSLTFEETTIENAVSSNPSLTKSVNMPSERRRYMRDIRKKRFFKIAPVYVGKSLYYRVLRKIRKIFK